MHNNYYLTSSAAMKYYMLATESGDREVGGYAEFRIDEHDNQIVTDLMVLRQEASMMHFTISERENALWLEKVVGLGKNPADFFLFHTHPTGMGSSMSSVDVDQIEEMARDLPGTVVRSMILSQGKLHPTINEAIYIEGRMWRRDDISMVILDNTGAKAALKEIGWFDKPKPVTPARRLGSPRYGLPSRVASNKVGFTADYGVQEERARELVPTRDGDEMRAWKESFYDDYPAAVSSPGSDAAYAAWLDDKREQAGGYLIGPDDDEAEEFIGEEVWYKGSKVTVIDAYVVDGDVILVMPDNANVSIDEVTMVIDDRKDLA